MIPTDTMDPRDPWAKIRRIELARMLEGLGVKVDGPNGLPPAVIMVNMLKGRGVQPPRMNGRSIGKDMNPRDWDTSPNSHQHNGNAQVVKKPAPVVTVDADELLAQEWSAMQMPDIETMDYNTLRRTAKAAGIKLSRRYGKADYLNLLREKNGKQDAS